ncbi:MAG: hypothetical protein COA42_19835 [Alteromonadaceae bacterium]|nr:MAG: hypothetical protein COA42_19835 [Alteromonadaceae bacterium]
MVLVTALVYILVVTSVYAQSPATKKLDVVKIRANAGPQYYYELIERALALSRDVYGDYGIELYAGAPSSARITEEVKQGDRLNLVWAPALKSVYGVDQLIPIPIPLLKGLSGFRVAIIHRDNQAAFGQIRDKLALNDMMIGLEFGWAEVAIYEANGISVTTAPYTSLYPMLQVKRIGALPLGVEQAVSSLSKRRHKFPDLIIDSELLIRYPMPIFFFVSQSTPNLAIRIRYGLELMIKRGEMDELFKRSFKEEIKSLNLKNRRVISIKNPLLLDEMPMLRKELWLNLEDLNFESNLP